MIKSLLSLILISVFFHSKPILAAEKCVLVLYDKEQSEESLELGKVYSIQLQNVLGHFPEFRQIISPLSYYEAGMIDACEATFYMGSDYYAERPQVFYDDLAQTKNTVVWMGYGIWSIEPTVLEKTFGIVYEGLSHPDYENLSDKEAPGFFRFYHYKGEVFRKSFEWIDDERKQAYGAFELSLVAPLTETDVLSTAEHNVTGEKVPYITQNKNFFFIADIPLSFIHEADRYLVFCDLLFDVLKTEPLHQAPLALVRIEDVHPLTPVENLEVIKETFEQENVPLNISFVPIYAKDVMQDSDPTQRVRIPFTEQPDFLSWVRKAKEDGVHFVLHGVTHHLDEVMNPVGYSGVDYEFWNVAENKPVNDGTASFLLDRLSYAYEYMESEEMHPMVWLTPHYLASPVEYRVLAQVFPWTLGRVTYFIDKPEGEPEYWNEEMLNLLQFSPQNKHVDEARRHYFQNYTNEFDDYRLGQFFPFEIYGDVYGHKIIPENLGNVIPPQEGYSGKTRSVDQILEDAKRNLVLRDNWASVFFHPFLINDKENGGLGEYSLDERELRRLLQGLKSLGYQFKTIEEFTGEYNQVPKVVRESIE